MKLLIANWKTNPATLEEAKILFEAEQSENVVICPPVIYLSALKAKAASEANEASLGAQDVFWEKGAHTGQVSVDMLKQFGVTHVLVGHSEKRAVGDTDEMINKKLKAALLAGLTPVLLVENTEQLALDIEGVNPEKVWITHEPSWAISTNPNSRPAVPEDALLAVAEMKKIAPNSKFFYGGSVDSKNLADFLKYPEISGAVVGGASLRAEEFKKMIEIAKEL